MAFYNDKYPWLLISIIQHGLEIRSLKVRGPWTYTVLNWFPKKWSGFWPKASKMHGVSRKFAFEISWPLDMGIFGSIYLLFLDWSLPKSHDFQNLNTYTKLELIAGWFRYLNPDLSYPISLERPHFTLTLCFFLLKNAG